MKNKEKISKIKIDKLKNIVQSINSNKITDYEIVKNKNGNHNYIALTLNSGILATKPLGLKLDKDRLFILGVKDNELKSDQYKKFETIGWIDKPSKDIVDAVLSNDGLLIVELCEFGVFSAQAVKIIIE